MTEPNIHPNIILCGFMGSGKSSVGKSLAKMLDMRFIDVDEYIESNNKMPISSIFEKFGEKYFREQEKEASEFLGRLENTVISCGGGTVLNENNAKLLKKNGFLFYLSVSKETVIKRLAGDNTRPLLLNKGSNEIFSLLESRAPVYKKVSDFTVNADASVFDVALQIEALYKNLCENNAE